MTPDKAFERYVFEQALKEQNPSDEDMDVGDLGGGDDGGVDGMFLYIGGQLIGEETNVPNGSSAVELHIIQAKYESGFSETSVEKLESFARDLLSFDKPVDDLTYLNSKARDSIGNFRKKYYAMLGRITTQTVQFHYACKAKDIPSPRDKIMTRAANLVAYVKSVLTLASVDFIPWASATLIDSVNTPPSSNIIIPFHRAFSTDDQSTVCLVKLVDFANKLLSKTDGSLQTRFLEPNVRDYNGPANTVNTGIRETLELAEPHEDFWWLNNGITILSSGCGTHGGQLEIKDPEIVNGLQTSHEVFNWYMKSRHATDGRLDRLPGPDDKRYILLRIIVTQDDESTTKIIKATNSQTKVNDISLLSTEPIQQTIEDRLRLIGLFYDRKKGKCRRLKRPIKKIVSMKDMAQAIIAISLRLPSQARGRPEQYIENNAAKVFRPGYGRGYLCGLHSFWTGR